MSTIARLDAEAVKTRVLSAGRSVPETPSSGFLLPPDASLERTELVNECMAAPGGSIVLIEAPAGFGKTFLLSQWRTRAHAARQGVAWIALCEQQHESMGFALLIVNVLAACGVKHLPTAADAASAASDELASRAFAQDLAEALRGHRRPVLLVLDDYQSVESDAADRLVALIVRHAVPNLVITIASRRMCRAPMSAAVLQGRVHRLDKRSLLFSKAETRSFHTGAFTPEERHSAFGMTGGWPAILQIARLCLNDWRNVGGEIQNVPSFAHLVREYYCTEVLADLSEREIVLLTDSAITESIDPNLCDAISQRSDSAGVLAALVARQTFLDPVDIGANRWQMPRLLRDFFHGRTFEQGSGMVAAAHLRAAAHLDGRGETLSAILHFLAAGDQVRAAHCLEQANPLRVAVCQGDERAAAFIDLIATDLLLQFPRLALCCAYLDFKRGLRRRAQALLEAVAARTDDFRTDRANGDDGQLAIEALHVELVEELYGCSRVSLEYLKSVERRIGLLQGDTHLSALSYHVLGILYALRGDLDEAERHFLFSQKLNERYQAPWRDLWLKYHFGGLALARGKLIDARHSVLSGQKLWRAQYRTYSSYGILSTLMLAEIDYEHDDLAEAQRKLNEAMYTGEDVEGMFEPYATAHTLAMMLHFHAGRRAELDAALTRPPIGDRIGGLLARFLQILRIRFLLLEGADQAAAVSLENLELEPRWAAPNFNDEFAYQEWDLLGICLAEIRIRERKFGEASKIVDRMEWVARASGRMRTIVKAMVFRAAIHLENDDPEGARSQIGSALDIGHTQGYRRVFLDEAGRIRPALAAYCARNVPGNERLNSYAQSLLRTLIEVDPRPNPKNAANLSTREQEVLRELGLGHSNKVIARKLALSEATVKFHVKNIFRKLNVRRRAAVVTEAHRHGLMS